MSSSYDSALVDTAMIDDPRQLMVPRGVRLLYLEALVWAKVRRTDGFIPTGALAKVTDEPAPEKGAAQLVAVGLWETQPLGWQIVDFTGTQMSAERVRRLRESTAVRYDKWRGQHPEHPKGKHLSNAVSNGVSNDTARPPARPPAREEAEGGGGMPPGGEPAAAAPRASLDSVSCSNYTAHQSRHRLSPEGWVCPICHDLRERKGLADAIRVAPAYLKERHLARFERLYPAYPAGDERTREQRNRRPLHPAMSSMHPRPVR